MRQAASSLAFVALVTLYPNPNLTSLLHTEGNAGGLFQAGEPQQLHLAQAPSRDKSAWCSPTAPTRALRKKMDTTNCTTLCGRQLVEFEDRWSNEGRGLKSASLLSKHKQSSLTSNPSE